MSVKAQQLLHQREGVTGRQYFVLVIDLILAVGLDSLCQVKAMTFAEVEQRPRGDGDHQFVAEILAHVLLLLCALCGLQRCRLCRSIKPSA
ncbi:hypothetical protein D3C75_699200 [compost metagenome]